MNGFVALANYVVDQDGHQLTEMDPDSNGTIAWQHTNVYANGTLMATYDSNEVHFHLNDWLGTRRAQTDYEGVREQTCSSLPFGDQLSCTNSTQFPTEHHFTGKERDQESGNDYFGARYYASSMGRFLSPDYDETGAAIEPVPYAALDNPLFSIDPSGHIPCSGVATITITVTPNGSSMSQSPDDCPTFDDLFAHLLTPTLPPTQKPLTTQIPEIGPPSFPIGTIDANTDIKEDYCAKQALLAVGKNAIAWDLVTGITNKSVDAFDKWEGLDDSDAAEANSGPTLPSSPGESAVSDTERAADFVATSATARQFVRAALRSEGVKVSARAVGSAAGAVGKYAGYAGAAYTLADAVRVYKACMSQ